MNCKKVKRELSAYLDEELDYKEKQIISEHLKLCAACRKEFNLFLNQDEFLRELETVEPSNDFRTNLWQRVKNIEEIILRKKTAINLPVINFPVISWIHVPVFCSIIIFVFLTFSISTPILYSNDMKTNNEFFVLVKKTFVPSLGQKIFSPLNFANFCDECCQILCQHCGKCEYCKERMGRYSDE